MLVNVNFFSALSSIFVNWQTFGQMIAFILQTFLLDLIYIFSVIGFPFVKQKYFFHMLHLFFEFILRIYEYMFVVFKEFVFLMNHSIDSRCLNWMKVDHFIALNNAQVYQFIVS